MTTLFVPPCNTKPDNTRKRGTNLTKDWLYNEDVSARRKNTLNTIFDVLPEEILQNVLTYYLDGTSLSRCLVALLGQKSNQQALWECFCAPLLLRVQFLCKSPYMPTLHGKLWSELPSHAGNILRISGDDFQSLLLRVRAFSQICIVLHFFESTVLQMERRDSDSDSGGSSGVEYPIWTGKLRVRAHKTSNENRPGRPDISNTPWTIDEEISIKMYMPHSTWCTLYLNAWGKLQSFPNIVPTVYRAVPLPPVLRICGKERNDDLALAQFASYLNQKNEVGSLRHGVTSFSTSSGGRFGHFSHFSSIVFMSRIQALQRWDSQPFIPRPLATTWPLTSPTKEGEDELFGFLVNRDYSKELEPLELHLLADSLLSFQKREVEQ